jgi:hypothetical protein
MVIGGTAREIDIPDGVFAVKVNVKPAVREGNFPRHDYPLILFCIFDLFLDP